MKVGIISNTSWSIYNFRRTLIQNMIEEGHEVYVMAPDKGDYKEKILEWDCKFVTLNQVSPKSINPLANYNFYLELRRNFKNIDADIIFSFTPKPNIWGAIACKGSHIKFIPTINGLGHAFITKGWLSFLVALLYKFAFSKLNRVIFQNPDDQQFFLKKAIINNTQASLVPGSGVDLQQFYVAPSNLRSNNETRFLYAGRLIKEKGVFDYVEAARVMKEIFPQATFYIKGVISDNPSSVTNDEIKNWIADGVVKYHEHTDDMSGFLNDIDVVVLPTYYREGIPKILIEAGAKGLPIIATNGIGCNQVIIDNYNGLVVKEKSVESLVEAMKKMVNMGARARKEMGLNGRARAEEKFDDKIVVSTYINLAGEREARLPQFKLANVSSI